MTTARVVKAAAGGKAERGEGDKDRVILNICVKCVFPSSRSVAIVTGEC